MSTNIPFWAVAQTGLVTPLGKGPPGCGKTASVRAFAQAAGRQCAVIVGSLREPTDIGGFPYPAETPEGVKYMALMPPKYAADAMSGKWVIFLDELTSCAEPVQTAMLDIVQSGRIGDIQLPDDTWRIAACNPTSLASNGHDLAPPMVTRLCHLNWEADTEPYFKGLSAGIVRRNGHGWEDLFPEPSFPVLPSDWENRLPDIGSRFTGYQMAFPAAVDRTPAEDDPEARDKASRPYPCMRSWRNAAICRAAVEACGGTAEDVAKVVAGCIGEQETAALGQWEMSLRLPDPEVVLQTALAALAADKPVTFTPPNLAYESIVLLSGIVQRALTDMPPFKPEARWRAGVALMDIARQRTAEVVAAVAPVLIQRKPAGAEIPVDFAEFLYRVLKGIGKLGL